MRLQHVIVVALLMLIMSTGCAQTPKARVVQAREAYSATLSVLVAARSLGQIDDKTAIEIERARVIAEAAIVEMDATAASGDTPAFRAAMAAYSLAIDKLIEWRTRIERKK